MAKKELAEDKNKQLAIMDMEADASQGYDNLGQDDFVMPFLRIVQKTSPIVDEDEPAYNKDAKVGMFFNSATGELLGSSVQVVDCFYERTFLEWQPDQGGLVGVVDLETFNSLPKDDSGRGITEAGNEVFDTRNHFMLVITESGPQPVLMSFKSTQIKKSKTWNTMGSNIKFDGANGKFTPPRFANIWTLETATESNDKGTWKGVQISGTPQRIEDAELYVAAKEFAALVDSGKANVDYSADNDAGESAQTTSDEKDEFE